MTLWQTLFGFAGRIGRATFWLLVVAVFLLDLAVVTLVSDWIRSRYLEGGIPHRPGGDVIGAGFVLLVVGILSGWAAGGLMVKRAHDLERSGWWLLIGLVPVYGLARLIMDLGFQAGPTARQRLGEKAGAVRGPLEPEMDRPAVLNLETAEPVQDTLIGAVAGPELTAPLTSTDAAVAFDGGLIEGLDAPSHDIAETGQALPEVPHEARADSASRVHPLMEWGKSYRADLAWPEFKAVEPPGSLEDMLVQTATEPSEASRADVEDKTSQEPAPVPAARPPADDVVPSPATVDSEALAWKPAPSHQAFVDLAPHTPSVAEASGPSQSP